MKLKNTKEDGKAITDNDTIKSCLNCDRRIGFFMEIAKCNYSGVYCSTEREYPTVCGRNYEHGWVKRRSLFSRIFNK